MTLFGLYFNLIQPKSNINLQATFILWHCTSIFNSRKFISWIPTFSDAFYFISCHFYWLLLVELFRYELTHSIADHWFSFHLMFCDTRFFIEYLHNIFEPSAILPIIFKIEVSVKFLQSKYFHHFSSADHLFARFYCTSHEQFFISEFAPTIFFIGVLSTRFGFSTNWIKSWISPKNSYGSSTSL